MSQTWTHYGWLVSPYSAKTRSYFRFKGIPFRDVAPSGPRLFLQIRRAVGAAIMPTVRSPEGRWLQDSSEIIDELEGLHPEPSIVPPGPAQRVAALLLELHGDEWLPAVALHHRWNVPANRDFAIAEFGRNAFPVLPGFVSARLARPVADKMSGYRAVLGVTPATVPGFESFTRDLIARLDAHLSAHDFLLGGRPSIGDFALFGPLWAHLFRDPGTTALFDEAPAARRWMQRLLEPAGEPGAFLPDDEVPATLDPIFRTLFEEQLPYVRDLVAAIDRWCDEHPGATRVPRSLGEHPFRIGGIDGSRRLLTFTQWMAQRPLEAYAALSEGERAGVDAWLDRVGGREAMRLPIHHPFERREFRMGLREPAGSPPRP